MAQLARLTRDALDRGLRAAGWRRESHDFYERKVSPLFELRAQLWIEGDPVEVQSLVSLTAPKVFGVLVDLVEEDLGDTLARDPLDEPVTIVRPEEVDTVAAEILGRIGATAEGLEAYASVDAFAAALESDPETRESAPMVVPVLLAVARRKREARERARLAPGDFADRLERWLGGERPPPPPGFEDSVSWRAVRAGAPPRARAAGGAAARSRRPPAHDLARHRAGRRQPAAQRARRPAGVDAGAELPQRLAPGRASPGRAAAP